MKDIFETSVLELSSCLCCILRSKKENEELKMLDWTDTLEDDEGYRDFSENAYDYQCKFTINIDNFLEEQAYDDNECYKFNKIHINNIRENNYDLVVLRRLTKYDNSIDDVIKRAAKGLKDGGVLYANLVITSELEMIFKAAEKYGLCPVAASKIILNDIRSGYYFMNNEDVFIKLYDMHGYIQLAFKKGNCEKFRYTEASDENCRQMDEDNQCVIYFKVAAFDGIRCALTGKECTVFSDEWDLKDKFSVDLKKWIRSSEEIDISRVNELFSRMKEDSSYGFGSYDQPYFPESEKIRFSDYFDVDTPRHTKLSELDTKEYYYLSPSNPIHCMIDNMINSDTPSLPEDILRRININNMGNIYNLVDANGKIMAAPENRWISSRGTICMEECDEYKPIELHALNNIADAGIDIAGTLLYNLIRIKPKGKKITLDYLKMFFYVDDDTRWIEVNKSNMQSYSLDEIKKMREEANIQAGRYAIHDFSDRHIDQSERNPETNIDENGVYRYTRFGTYNATDVLNAYIYVDDIKKHKKLIERFKRSQDTAMAIVHKRFADAAFLENLHKRENEVKARYDDKTAANLINVEEQLALGEQSYKDCLNHKKDISLQYHFVAVEIYLKLCLACCKNKEEIYCGKDRYGKDRSIEDIGKFMMNDLCYIYCNYNNKQHLFKKDVEDDKYNLLLQRLPIYRDERNKPSHSFYVVKAAEAEDMIKEIYETIMMIDEIIAN